MRHHTAKEGTDDGTKPAFRSVIDELLDTEVDERQIVDEINTMMFGVA